MSTPKITIRRVETDFYPTLATPPQKNRADRLDSFLECRSRSALGCLAEGFVNGFIAGFTSPFWIASACAETAEIGSFIPSANDAMPNGAQRLVSNRGNTQRTDTAVVDVEDVNGAIIQDSTVVTQDVQGLADTETAPQLKETDTNGTDAVVISKDIDYKEIPPPPKPLTCDLKQTTINCIEGAETAPIKFMIQGATSFICDGQSIPISTDAADLSIPFKPCTTKTITCQVKNTNTNQSANCPSLTITATKPNSVPEGVPLGPSGVVVPKGGNYCPKADNTVPFSVFVSDGDGDALTVGLRVYYDNVEIVGSKMPPNNATYTITSGLVTFNLSATSLSKGPGEYCYDFTLDDSKGGKTTTSRQCFYAAQKGLLGLWRFNSMGGNTVQDEKSNQNGSIIGGNQPSMWETDKGTGAKMLCFKGDNRFVQITNVPDSWKKMEKLTFHTRVLIEPDTNIKADRFLIHWSLGEKHGLLLRFQDLFKKTIFGFCDKSIVCQNTWWWWATADNKPLATQGFHEITGVINMGIATLYVDGNKMGATPEINIAGKEETTKAYKTPSSLGDKITFGKLATEDNTGYSFKGCVDSIALYNVDATQPCQ